MGLFAAFSEFTVLLTPKFRLKGSLMPALIVLLHGFIIKFSKDAPARYGFMKKA